MPRFIEVMVESHDLIEEDCCMRFQAVDTPREVKRVRWGVLSGQESLWDVAALDEDGTRGVARAATVEDSGGGACVLVWGGSYGLRLTNVDTGAVVAEAYLLVSAESLIA